MSYWIVDRHVDNGATSPPPIDGLLYEMSLGEAGPPPPPPPPPPPGDALLFGAPISDRTDDADETQDGTVRRTPGDVELGSGSGLVPTTAALRFRGVQIPNGATILGAQVQFTVDETSRRTTNLTIRAERADNSAPIGTNAFNISSRPRTAASVAWSVPAWQTLGAAGADQRTPNLAAVLQEVVSRAGWASGNAFTVIVTGTGRRTAESFEGGKPAVLSVQYAAP
jgi:hypothetical protein